MSPTIWTILVVALVLIWLAQLALLYVAAENQGTDPIRVVSGATIFFPVPFPVAQAAPSLVDRVAGFWESLISGIFGGRNGEGAPLTSPAAGGRAGQAGEATARLLVDGQEVALNLARTRLGRYPNNEVVIDHTTVSAYHAEIIRRPDGRHEIVDRESRNGTRVNGALIRSQILKDGDLITLGGATLHYLASPPAIEQQQPGFAPQEPYQQPGGQSPPRPPAGSGDYRPG